MVLSLSVPYIYHHNHVTMSTFILGDMYLDPDVITITIADDCADVYLPKTTDICKYMLQLVFQYKERLIVVKPRKLISDGTVCYPLD